MNSGGLLEAVKSRLDIVEVISEYVQLKRAGVNYKGLCPFHNEKTPSFVVSPEKQVFHCFGCSAGGDLIGFVMKYEAMEFPEALRFLAEKAGLDPDEFQGGRHRAQTEEKKLLKDLLKEAADFYAGCLDSSAQAKDYLKARGVETESIGKFRLGYAPGGWRALVGHLQGMKRYPESLILKSGVVQKGQAEGQKPYDFFRERVIFPIHDTNADVIAFGGRVMDNSLPKYINSPDTALFRKAETLYGLHFAKDAIRKKGWAVLVEGYLDVLMCHQHGFENTAAPLGTALTAGHLRKLKRFTNRLVVVFDGDAAGIGAAKRTLGLALEQDFRVKVALLPPSEDPDSILRTKGAPAFKKLLGGSATPVRFILKTATAPRVDTIKEAAALVSIVPDPIMREEFITELSELGKIREQALRQEIKKTKTQAKNTRPDEKPGVGGLRHTAETLLLSVFVNLPEKRDAVLGALRQEQLHEPLVKSLFDKLKKGDSPLPEILSDEEKSLLAWVSIEPGFSPSEAEESMEGCIKKMRIKGLEEKIRQAHEKGDAGSLKTLYKQRERLKEGPQGL